MDEVQPVPVRTHQRLPALSETPQSSKLRLARREAGDSGWMDFVGGFVFFVLLFYETGKKKGSLRLSQINLFSKHWDISQINFV